MRTAYNMIIYEALDFTVGLFDAKGNILSIGLGLPMFIRGIADTIKAKLKHFGPENIKPGDILLTNDAYITGSHLNHMTFSVPIFVDGRLLALCRLHGALARYRRHARRHHHRHLLRGSAAPDRQGLPRGRRQRGHLRDHPHERAPAGAGDGRPPGPDRRGQDRRETLCRDGREIRRRRGAGGDRRDHGPERGRLARPHRRDPGRGLRGRIVHGRRRRHRRKAHPDPGQGHDRRRPHDGRPDRPRRARSRASTIPARRRAGRAARSPSNA